MKEPQTAQERADLLEGQYKRKIEEVVRENARVGHRPAPRVDTAYEKLKRANEERRRGI